MLYLKSKAFVYNLFSAKPYIPKDATQQDLFLSKYPDFDGRGIKIAIIDTGIDLSLEGLQKTSEGFPKIIDCFDFTESGNVETSVIKEIDSKNYLIGLSGKKFKIPKNWKNPSGKWHLGLKALYKQTIAKSSEKLPEIDCIVWFNGEKWCFCIETYKKDLSNAKVLTNFCDANEYGILNFKGNEIVYCISVKNDGNLLEIFTRNFDYGTNTALIAAANFPEKSENNGLAPGAQIISLNIFDPSTNIINFEHMERALEKCIEMNVDIVIYSGSSFSGDKEIEKLIQEMYNKHNILLFKCSGNSGPLYSTVPKCDSNVENYIFKIGAVLTSEIQKRAYHIFGINDTNPPPPVVYSWSSRGPGGFRSHGVDFVAPGVLRRKTSTISFENFFHGTNYSSANAAGAVACLLSGLKAKSIQYSPDLIKFALFKTAFLPKNENIFEFGHGIIQINEAFEYFCKNVIEFKNIPKLSNVAEGIMFIPNDGKEQVVLEESVDLSNYINYENQDTTELKLQVSKNAENFMEVSKINENNLSFFVKVDTNKLEAGNFNFGEIMILHPKIGSIFNIPIFVCNPIKVSETQNFYIKKETFLTYEKPYQIRFYPENINICDIKITASKCLITNCWIQYCFPYSMNVKEANNTKKFLIFSRINPSEKLSIKVNKNEVFEICIYQMVCATLPNAKFTLEFNFKNEDQKEGESANGTN